jgi:hypothetical protein
VYAAQIWNRLWAMLVMQVCSKHTVWFEDWDNFIRIGSSSFGIFRGL